MLEARRSGRGQVVDAAMVDGSALLMASIYGAHQSGFWSDERGTHLLDSGAHFYDVYETADGGWVSVGSIEPPFYAALLERLGLSDEELPDQMDREAWPELKRRFAEIFRTRTRDEWCAVFEGSDACFAPVLGMAEVHAHPHNRARDTFHEVHGTRQPRPAPRFSRTRAEVSRPPAAVGAHSDEILAESGWPASEIQALRASGAIR
jgi:alpha-methylacyl-CoA racemase